MHAKRLFLVLMVFGLLTVGAQASPPEECYFSVAVTPLSAQLDCVDGHETGSITLTATVYMPRDLVSVTPSITYRWYQDGDLVQEGAANTLVVSTPGVYWVSASDGQCTAWSNHVTVAGCEPEPPCTRADVSVIIYGGWDGIPVQAWVGGTAQPTRTTELDAFGRPAVLWTFYPPEGTTWTVTVTPQLPGGLDPERWVYEPTSASVASERCSEHQLTFRLIDNGPEVEVILPETGGQLSWWQGLLHWLRGLFAG